MAYSSSSSWVPARCPQGEGTTEHASKETARTNRPANADADADAERSRRPKVGATRLTYTFWVRATAVVLGFSATVPDPHALYVVSAAVTLGLATWAIRVFVRGEPILAPAPAGGPSEESSSDPPSADESKPALTGSKLSAHLEIRDKPVVSGADLSVDVEEEEEPTGPTALILVTAVGRTDPGLRRKHNEDAYLIMEDHQLVVIADGMGRHAAGEVASQLCIAAIREAFEKSDFGPSTKPAVAKYAGRLRGAIFQSNRRIFEEARKNVAWAGMGTTVVAAYFALNNQRVHVAHVGDSRCYRLRGTRLTQLTADHTLGAAGVQGKSASVLSRAVGIEEEVEVEFTTESPLPGDVYLLCSDGLSRMLQDEEIQEVLEGVRDLEEATKVLIDKANARGGRDNITAILVRIDHAKLNFDKK